MSKLGRRGLCPSHAARASCETIPDGNSKPSLGPFPVAPAVLWKEKAQTSSLHTNHQALLSPTWAMKLSGVLQNIQHAKHPRNGHKGVRGGQRKGCLGLSPRVSCREKHFIWH